MAPHRRPFVTHTLNYVAGWYLVLAAFVAGAVLGLGYHREDFLGGYGSWRRRLLRLGHIALAALGLLNLAYGLTPTPPSVWPGALLLSGAVTMPAVCFLAAWRPSFRHAFFLPVMLLGIAVVLILHEVQP